MVHGTLYAHGQCIFSLYPVRNETGQGWHYTNNWTRISQVCFGIKEGFGPKIWANFEK